MSGQHVLSYLLIYSVITPCLVRQDKEDEEEEEEGQGGDESDDMDEEISVT